MNTEIIKNVVCLRLITAVLVSIVFGIAGCSNDSDDLGSKLRAIESEFDDVMREMRYLESEIDNLSFQSSGGNVDSVVEAFADLKRAVRDVEYEF